MRLHSVGKCRHEKFSSITKPKLKLCNQLRNAAAAILKKCAMNHFVQRLNLDGGGFRQNGRDEHLSELFKHALVYVIHHDAGNSGKMANGKENRKRPDDCVKITQKGVWHPIKLPHE
jgi:hypothetical protein